VPDDPLSAANRRISILLPFTNTPESAPNAQDMAAQKTDSMISDIGTPIKRNY
jgi:hypothetical protein